MTVFFSGRPLDAVLFDLDGTLLETARDIALALNRATAELGWPPLSEAVVRRLIGRGAPLLIERAAAALGRAVEARQREALLQRFLDHYGGLESSGEVEAAPYPGVREALAGVRAAGLRTAVVTNKLERFADALLARLGLETFIDVVIGGDSCERRKPDPEPLLLACRRLDATPARALMVGDSINDVEAARGAGMPIVCVPYGYNEGEDPRKLPCDALIESLTDLLPLLRRRASVEQPMIGGGL